MRLFIILLVTAVAIGSSAQVNQLNGEQTINILTELTSSLGGPDEVIELQNCKIQKRYFEGNPAMFLYVAKDIGSYTLSSQKIADTINNKSQSTLKGFPCNSKASYTVLAGSNSNETKGEFEFISYQTEQLDQIKNSCYVLKLKFKTNLVNNEEKPSVTDISVTEYRTHSGGAVGGAIGVLGSLFGGSSKPEIQTYGFSCTAN